MAEHVEGHRDEGGEGGRLVVGPLVVPHLVLEDSVVVGAGADVDDEVVAGVGLLQVAGHVLNGVPVGLLQHPGGREGHRDHPRGYVGQVQLFPLVAYRVLRSSHHLSNDAEHASRLL